MITFWIAGERVTSDDLMITIPIHYRDLFDGHRFDNLSAFSKALMYASGAAEGRYYNRPHIVKQNEEALWKCLFSKRR